MIVYFKNVQSLDTYICIKTIYVIFVLKKFQLFYPCTAFNVLVLLALRYSYIYVLIIYIFTIKVVM